MVLRKIFDVLGVQKTYATTAEYLASPEAKALLNEELARDDHEDFLTMRDRKPDEWADDVEADMLPAEMLDLVEARAYLGPDEIDYTTPEFLAWAESTGWVGAAEAAAEPVQEHRPRSIIKPTGGPKF